MPRIRKDLRSMPRIGMENPRLEGPKLSQKSVDLKDLSHRA